VARRDPDGGAVGTFRLRGGRGQPPRVEFAVPEGSELPNTLSEEEFPATPADFFERGKETIWLQILNLDARGETPFGPTGAILGDTFRREYPDLFQPSFGAAQSLGDTGLPAKLFFSPVAMFETPFGAFRTRRKALLGSRIESIPPVGSSPRLLGAIPLDTVEELRAPDTALREDAPAANLLALAHPIDAELQGDDPFQLVQSAIGRVD
jgi:hypothetical protein